MAKIVVATVKPEVMDTLGVKLKKVWDIKFLSAPCVPFLYEGKTITCIEKIVEIETSWSSGEAVESKKLLYSLAYFTKDGDVSVVGE
jgi:hypothetical protein